MTWIAWLGDLDCLGDSLQLSPHFFLKGNPVGGQSWAVLSTGLILKLVGNSHRLSR